MIKMIKPIVNISKVIEPYNTVIVGFNGVLSEGNGVKSEAVEALIQMKRAGISFSSLIPRCGFRH